MKKLISLLSIFLTLNAALAADVKISALPLGSAATTGVADSFPYVQSPVNITKRLTLWDLVSLPPLVSTYAPKASPAFTGTVSMAGDLDVGGDVTAVNLIGSLAASDITGTLGVTHGGTGLASTTINQLLYSSATSTIAGLATANTSALVTNSSGVPSFTSGGTANRLLRTNGTAVTFAQAALATDVSGTLPVTNGGTGLSSTTINQLLYSSATSTIAGLSSTATGALVTDSSSVPSFASGTTANRVLRTNGTAVTFAQVAAATDISGTLAASNGGTGAATLTANNVLLGNGTSAVQFVAPGTSGNILTSNGTTWTSAAVTAATVPTVQKFTSGSGTYTTPANVLYIRVRMVGGGGGGAGSGTASGGTGGTGGDTTFGSSLLSASGGVGAVSGSNSGGAGGAASLGTGPIGSAIHGTSGGGGNLSGTALIYYAGGQGGSAPFFSGAGGGTLAAAGSAGQPNTGGGGAGGGSNTSVSNNWSGGGGGSGGFVEGIIGAPSATYAYAVGAAGTAGSAGTGGFAGGAAGAGGIEVWEYYR